MAMHALLNRGFADDNHRRAFMAATYAWLAAGGPRRCIALTKQRKKCEGWAMRGCDYCSHHARGPVQEARRLRLLTRPATPKQAAYAKRREHRRIMQRLWKHNRFAAGATITLGPREDGFVADLHGLGFTLAELSPASADAARWLWIGLTAGRVLPDQFRDRMRLHMAKDRAHVGL